MSKRANGEGTIRKRNNGTWEARYTADGEQHSLYGPTQKLVKEKLREILADIADGNYLEESNLAYGQWLNIWRENWLDDIAPSTAQKYKSDSLNHIDPIIGKVPLKELSASHLKKVLKTAKDKGLAEKTVINIRIALHKSLEAAVEDKRIKHNPCTKYVRPPAYEEPPKEMRPLKDDEVARFLRAIAGTKYENAYFVDLFTGLRESELIGLTWDCIDFDAGTIHVYRQYVRPRSKTETHRFTKLKNKKTRDITPPPSVMTVLRKVKTKQAEQKLLAGTSWLNNAGFVFTNEIGKPLSLEVLYRNLKKVASDIGVPELRFHDLRHTYATLSLQNGADPKTVSANLGHYSVAFTLDKYAHVSKTMMNNCAEKMEAFIQAL